MLRLDIVYVRSRLYDGLTFSDVTESLQLLVQGLRLPTRSLDHIDLIGVLETNFASLVSCAALGEPFFEWTGENNFIEIPLASPFLIL